MEQAQAGEDGVKCYFWAGTAGSGPAKLSKCEQKASGFVRVKHSGRLCPLCGPCKESFVQARGNMSEEAKKTIPGEASYEDVALEAGAEEYAKQPPKK